MTLLAFRNLSGQLCRRSIDVHFGRYRADRPGEAAIFVNVFRSFAAQLPLEEPRDLVKDWEFLYERSIGCVGHPKRVVGHGAVSRCLDAAPLTLSERILKLARYLSTNVTSFFRSASREKRAWRRATKVVFACACVWASMMPERQKQDSIDLPLMKYVHNIAA